MLHKLRTHGPMAIGRVDVYEKEKSMAIYVKSHLPKEETEVSSKILELEEEIIASKSRADELETTLLLAILSAWLNSSIFSTEPPCQPPCQSVTDGYCTTL